MAALNCLSAIVYNLVKCFFVVLFRIVGTNYLVNQAFIQAVLLMSVFEQKVSF